MRSLAVPLQMYFQHVFPHDLSCQMRLAIIAALKLSWRWRCLISRGDVCLVMKCKCTKTHGTFKMRWNGAFFPTDHINRAANQAQAFRMNTFRMDIALFSYISVCFTHNLIIMNEVCVLFVFFYMQANYEWWCFFPAVAPA